MSDIHKKNELEEDDFLIPNNIDGIDGIDYVICGECGRKMKQVSYAHITNVHNMSMEEYREKHPGRLICKITMEKNIDSNNKTRNNKTNTCANCGIEIDWSRMSNTCVKLISLINNKMFECGKFFNKPRIVKACWGLYCFYKPRIVKRELNEKLNQLYKIYVEPDVLM